MTSITLDPRYQRYESARHFETPSEIEYHRCPVRDGFGFLVLSVGVYIVPAAAIFTVSVYVDMVLSSYLNVFL